MVSFQCEQCGDTLTKKKLDAHSNRCWNTSYTCLDCMTTFHGNAHRSHTSCVSEAQKYQGALYKGDKKAKGQPSKPTENKSSTSGAKPPKAAYVEDVPDSPNPSFTAESTAVEAVPPPAPSPPPAKEDAEEVNVFDFLEPDSPASSASSVSSYKSSKQENGLPRHTVDIGHTPAPRMHLTRDPPSFTYGNAPIPTSASRYDSDLDVAMSDAAQMPMQTPAAPNDHNARILDTMSGSQSDKKRKRGSPDEPETSIVRASRTRPSTDGRTLHSGLTGGLHRLMTDPEEEIQAQASPLSPKKRSKRSKEEQLPLVTATRKHKKDETAAPQTDAEKRVILKSRGDVTRTEGKSLRRSERHGKSHDMVHAPKSGHLIKKQVGELRQRPEQSHSEFFLGLIDKGPDSNKGQSVWGVMKMFHEGLLANGDVGLEGEDKRLFRGLRMKKSKHGEIVLFSRPEAELDA